jgi:hypothetical protein
MLKKESSLSQIKKTGRSFLIAWIKWKTEYQGMKNKVDELEHSEDNKEKNKCEQNM